MARTASFTTTGQPITAPPMTLDAMMQRQRELAKTSPSANREMISPWQGAAYLGEVISQNVQQNRIDRELADARSQFAQVMSGVDYGAGPTGDQIGQAMMYDPDAGSALAQLAASMAQRKLEREQLLGDRTEQRSYDASVKAGDRDYAQQDQIADEQRATAAQIAQEERNKTSYAPVITGEAARAEGLDPTKSYQKNLKTGLYDPIGGSASTTINVGGNETSTGKKFGEKEGERFDTYVAAGNKAAGLRADMQLLDALGQVAPQGPVPGKLQKMFPGINSAGAAFQAVAKRLAPQMRVEGSGATSDIEYQGMVDSLPNLGNYPEANRLISAMIRAKSEIDLKRAEIVTAWANQTKTIDAARAELNALNRQSIMSPELQALMDAAQQASPGLGADAGAAPPSDLPSIPATDMEGYRALPDGAQYTIPGDPTVYTKGAR